MENNTEQHSNSISLETKLAELTKAQRREFHRRWQEFVHGPRMKPWRINGNPKVAWRIRKKWFNRFYKSRKIGYIIPIKRGEDEFSVERITDLYMRKEGGRNAYLEVTTETIISHTNEK